MPDTRVPIIDNYKKVIKKIEFKKSYLNLLLNNNIKMDNAILMFYSIASGNSFFADEPHSTLDKLIGNLPDEDFAYLIELHRQYNNNQERIRGQKFHYNEIIQLIRLMKSSISGRSFVNVITEFYDCISMMHDMNLPINPLFKLKDVTQLHEHHRQLQIAYKMIADVKLEEKLKAHVDKFRQTEIEIDGVEFKLLDTVEKFYKESEFMHHCVKTYVGNVANGSYVIYGVKDNETGDRATLSVHTDKDKYSFNQLKTINNRTATKKIIESTKLLLNKYFDLHKLDSYDLQPKEESQNLVPDLF